LTNYSIKTVPIVETYEICKDIKNITFNVQNLNENKFGIPKPGQFVMIWVPGVDEIPMSISDFDDKGNCSILVKNIGECTNALHNLKIGDYIGFRGPFGNWFEPPIESFKKIFLITGGIGIAPMRFFISELNKLNKNYVIINGATLKNELVYIHNHQNFDKEVGEIFYCTDDGSYGTKGFASDVFNNVINDYSDNQLSNAAVYTCGPEQMMYRVFQICEKKGMKLQASLERIMRCGCGLCGLCSIDPLGLLVCRDGPIFKSEILRKLEDFGKYKRDFTGKKIKI
jgi:dihydroorotate dehydrogenase electron transfer subunit